MIGKTMCEYCDCSKRKILLEKEILDSTSFGWGGKETKLCLDEVFKSKLSVFVDRGYLRLVDPGDCDCLDHGETCKINFCPICGKKLK